MLGTHKIWRQGPYKYINGVFYCKASDQTALKTRSKTVFSSTEWFAEEGAYIRFLMDHNSIDNRGFLTFPLQIVHIALATHKYKYLIHLFETDGYSLVKKRNACTAQIGKTCISLKGWIWQVGRKFTSFPSTTRKCSKIVLSDLIIKNSRQHLIVETWE